MAVSIARSFPKGQPKIPGSPKFPQAPSRVPALNSFTSSGSVRLRDMQGRFTKGGFGFEWTNLEGVLNIANDTQAQILQGLQDELAQLALEIQIYAQDNAPWEDRTGDARQGLKAVLDVNTASGRYTISLGHSVDYGFYLENSDGGKFAIIIPTIRHFQDQIGSILDTAMNTRVGAK